MAEPSSQPWDLQCDVLVVGSGGGALAGALLAARAGLRVVLIEKTDQYGGTTAYSGGALWIPLSAPNQRAGVEDSLARVEEYLDACVGQHRRELRDAYLAAGPGVIADLEKDQWLEFEWQPFPDYFCEAPGAHAAGRSIYAVSFDATGHEAVVEHLRQPLPAQKGGWQEPFRLIIRGRAFLARVLVSLAEMDAVLMRDTALDGLAVADDRVVGATADRGGTPLRIRAQKGVLLAAGGFERDDDLRHAYQDPLGADWTLGAPGNTGTALRAAVEAGVDTELLEERWWAPGLMLPDGTAAFRLFEGGKPGSILVNGAGFRFADETRPYNRLGRAILATGRAPRRSPAGSWSTRPTSTATASPPPRREAPSEQNGSTAAPSSPAVVGTKGGIRCDPSGRALRHDGTVLRGLYAAGNTMASWTNHCYPGPGVPIGTCVVFAALAVRDMIG